MKKRLFSLFLCVALILSMMLTVSAAGENVLDMTTRTANGSGEGWDWDNASKTLTLNGLNLTSDAEKVIVLPDGATIKLTGENKIATTSTTAKAIWCNGKITITGTTGSSFDISVGGGYAIYAEGDASVTLEGVKLTANGAIELPDANTNSTLTIKNSDVNIARNALTIRSKMGVSSFILDNSLLYSGPVFTGAWLSSNHDFKTAKAVFQVVNGSTLDAQNANGSAKSPVITIWGDCGVDVDVTDSYIRTWNSGWQAGNIDVQGGNIRALGTDAAAAVLDVNIQRSNIYMYGYWAHLSISRYYSDDATINFNLDESTVLNASKYGTSGISIAAQTATGMTTDTRTDSITVLTSDGGHTGQTMTVEAPIIGNPVIHHDFDLTLQSGGTNDFSTVDFDFVLAKDQTLTIQPGKKMTSVKTLVMEEGAQIHGNYAGALEVDAVAAAKGMIVRTSGSGDSFTAWVDLPIPTHDVTVVNGTGSGVYSVGDTVTVTANAPASDYSFAGWTVTGADLTLPNTTSVTFFMPDSDVTVSAIYSQDPVVTVVNGTGGGAYKPGQSVTVTADPKSGYTFAGWTVVGADLTLPKTMTATFTMPAANVTVTANYTKNFDFTSIPLSILTASASDGGKISFAGSRYVVYGKQMTYTMTPDEGYALTALLVNGQPVEVTDNTYTFRARGRSFVIEAIFSQVLPDTADEALLAVDESNAADPVTRAEIIDILWTLAGAPVVESTVDFFDVAADAPNAAVAWAGANGITAGNGENLFAGEDTLTRAELIDTLHAYAAPEGDADAAVWAASLELIAADADLTVAVTREEASAWLEAVRG